MSLTVNPAPVRRQITVAVRPERAFEVFTGSIARWWPKAKSIGRAPQAGLVIEPRAGGRWFEIGKDGSQQDWGEVLVWEPPARLVLAWRIGAAFRFDPDLLTEVEVRFVAEGEGHTRVELEHRHLERWGERAEETRKAVDSPGGWTEILAVFAHAIQP